MRRTRREPSELEKRAARQPSEAGEERFAFFVVLRLDALDAHASRSRQGTPMVAGSLAVGAGARSSITDRVAVLAGRRGDDRWSFPGGLTDSAAVGRHDPHRPRQEV